MIPFSSSFPHGGAEAVLFFESSRVPTPKLKCRWKRAGDGVWVGRVGVRVNGCGEGRERGVGGEGVDGGEPSRESGRAIAYKYVHGLVVLLVCDANSFPK